MRRPLPLPTNDPGAGLGGGAASLWTIDGDMLVTVASFDVGPAIVLVPTEHVLLAAIDLPLPSARRRLEALPFAIEDRVAQPLGEVHTALGTALGERTWLAGVVAHGRMRDWTQLLQASGLDQAALVPDVLGLPVPPAGAWSVEAAADRILVRTEDGAGFAIAAEHIAAAWAAAGRPKAIVHGGALPAAIPFETGLLEEGPAARFARPALDLRQGPYAPPRRAVSPLWRRVALVAAVGACAHAAIAGVDTLAVRHIAARKAGEVSSLVQQVAPGAVVGEDVAARAAEILPASGPGPSTFLPLFARVGAALRPLGGAIRMHAISYDASAGTMSIEVEAGTLEGLQQVGSALSAAGVQAQAGAASQSDGKAVGAFLVRGAG